MSRRLLRVLGCQLFCLALTGSANAGPILMATFNAIIPDLTVTQQQEISDHGVATNTTTTTTHVQNVPVTGAFLFDGAAWGLTTLDPSFAPFPVHSLTVTDPPSGGGTDPGVTTQELLRANLSIGGGVNVPLAFNRDLVNSMPAGSTVISPFQSTQSIWYLEGSEDLAVPTLGFEGGDVFFASLFNNFSYVTPDAFAASPGEVVGFTDSNSMTLEIGSGFLNTPVSFFGPGAPLAFSWVDGTPGVCPSACDDFVTLQGRFNHGVERTTFLGPQTFQFDTTIYGGQFVFSRVDLQDTTVPEPATLSLLGTGLLGGAVARRRRRGRAAPSTTLN